jgi:hypothetical protein
MNDLLMLAMLALVAGPAPPPVAFARYVRGPARLSPRTFFSLYFFAVIIDAVFANRTRGPESASRSSLRLDADAPIGLRGVDVDRRSNAARQ